VTNRDMPAILAAWVGTIARSANAVGRTLNAALTVLSLTLKSEDTGRGCESVSGVGSSSLGQPRRSTALADVASRCTGTQRSQGVLALANVCASRYCAAMVSSAGIVGGGRKMASSFTWITLSQRLEVAATRTATWLRLALTATSVKLRLRGGRRCRIAAWLPPQIRRSTTYEI
jgi:hypothetical protein